MVICAADGENEAYGSQDRSDRKGRDGWAYAWCFLSGWCDVGFRRFWNYRTLRVPDWSCRIANVLPTSPIENKFLKGNVRIAPHPAHQGYSSPHDHGELWRAGLIPGQPMPAAAYGGAGVSCELKIVRAQHLSCS